MGCSNSIAQQTKNNYDQQPLRRYNPRIIQSQSKIIQLCQKDLFQQNKQVKIKQSLQIEQNLQLRKKQQKIKHLKNNKQFVQLSIQTSYCVNRVLNTLAHNDLFQQHQLKNLISKNNQVLIQKQNRYKNLQKREEKLENDYWKQINKKDRNKRNSRSTVCQTPNFIQNQRKLSQLITKTVDVTDYQNNSSKNKFRSKINDEDNKENVPNSSSYFDSDYKAKFIVKIDKFRTQVNRNTTNPKQLFH